MASTWPDFALNTAAKRRKIDILEQCLRHGSSPQTTGSDLAADVSSDDNLKDSIISAWGIITSAVNVFSSDEDIAKIVKILITFASLAPTAEEAGIDSNLYATRSWTTLGWTLNENDWNGGAPTTFCTIHSASLTPRIGFGTNPKHYKDESAYSKAIMRFLIANKFVAHLLRAGTGRYKIFMIWTMRSALEYSPEQRSGMEDPEVYVPAAAACVMIAGEKLRSFDDEWLPGELTGRPALGGPLWEGKHGFCEGRWRLWKERFEAVAQESGISEGVKRKAKEAHDEMERFDKDM
ncbi:hypothetical protein Q7P35_010098 [Cladosporium inversicolor]